MPKSIKAKPELCLACETRELRTVNGSIEGHNAYSRYGDAWICSDCGVREALEGFFWTIRAKAAGVQVKPHHQHLMD